MYYTCFIVMFAGVCIKLQKAICITYHTNKYHKMTLLSIEIQIFFFLRHKQDRRSYSNDLNNTIAFPSASQNPSLKCVK